MNLRSYLAIAAIAASPAFAQQQQGAPQKTTEQQARSYVASAFITGAAPVIMSQKVSVSPALRQHLSLDEISASEAPAPVSQQPIFAVEAGSATLIVQYDLGHDNISFVGLPGAVATSAPVMAPTPPEKVADTPVVVPTAAPVPAVGTVVPAAGTVVDAPKPAPTPEQKPMQVVEPTIPRAAKPAPAAAVAPRPAQPVVMMQEPKLPPLKPNGACVIKPVMSDQDLVNCGATPR
jgi:hypothetical protein